MEKCKTDYKYWLALGKNTKLGSASFAEILSKNIPFDVIYFASKNELLSFGLSEKTVKEILFAQTKYEPDQVAEELEKREISYVTLCDEGYPKLLKEIYNPPAILYYKGQLDDDALKIGIVGSRRPTQYGIEATNQLSADLARCGVTIVSGMAIGIDTIAHRACLAQKGKTIALLGCGLDQIYPSSNVTLAKAIIENGAIISEFPIGVHPFKVNFVIRNRIISGLSQGILVTEAAESSGSLITATYAVEQNREVFAVPGPIFNRNSKGGNNLIKMGAKLVTSASDILDELGLEVSQKTKEPPKGDNLNEQKVIDLLLEEPKNIEQIIKETKLEQKIVSQTLTMLEISGKVKHLGGTIYKLNC